MILSRGFEAGGDRFGQDVAQQRFRARVFALGNLFGASRLADRIENDCEENERRPDDAAGKVFQHLPFGQQPCIGGNEDLEGDEEGNRNAADDSEENDAVGPDNEYGTGRNRQVLHLHSTVGAEHGADDKDRRVRSDDEGQRRRQGAKPMP